MTRATFAGISTALSALQASQKRLDIVGQNLSNMNTVGYTRQQLETSSLNYTGTIAHYTNGTETAVGFGVQMDKVSQIRDPYLDAQYRQQMSKSGYSDSMQISLDSLEKAFDESNIDGIRSAIDDIQLALLDMQDPAKINDPVYESELRSRMQSLTNLLNDAARQVEQAQKDEFSKLDGTGTSENGAIETVNDILQQIGALNRQIKTNQILGQQSLELQDERNNLLDTLSSYLPIEVTYFKDAAHDGINADTDAAENELYEKDAYGNKIGRKEWPDDLKVELVYTDEKGNTNRLTLVDGTEGSGEENYGSLSIEKGSLDDPTSVSIKFTAAESTNQNDVSASATGAQFASGSIQASLDMLGKAGTGKVINGTQTLDDVRGYQYYTKCLNDLAETFAKTINGINNDHSNNNPKDNLLAQKGTDTATGITAKNIGISKGWTSGTVHVSTGKEGDDANAAILDMYEALNKTYTELGDKSFADYMNNVSTILANDSSYNSNSLKTNVTVLNGIQDSRDSISGISLDEEASNMMIYVSAYNAASRLMTAMDEILNTLISGTGLVGR